MIPNQLDDICNYFPKTPLTSLQDPWLEQYNVKVLIKRDDLIDSKISGNKFRKLKYALIRYSEADYSGILSFGGPWSNHLHALSYLTAQYDIPSIAIIRGEQPKVLSDTLMDIQRTATVIQYVSRDLYRKFRELATTEKLYHHPFFSKWQDYMIIPEGGSSKDALAGVAEILSEDEQNFDAIYLPCGTGATLAGLVQGLKANAITKIIGVAALRAGNSLDENVRRLIATKQDTKCCDWHINNDFHFGGFAKITNELILFMNQLYKRTGLITEPVYTAKTLFALYEHIKEGTITSGSKIMLLHTGGLQGLRGFRGKGIDHLINQKFE